MPQTIMAILQDYGTQSPCPFTVITLLDQRLDYLDTWLKSLLRQEHDHTTEIIMIHDARAGFTRENLEVVLQDYQRDIQQHPYHFFYIENTQNAAAVVKLNQAVHNAHGEWIYFVNSSEILLKNAFLEFAAVIKEFPHVEIISGRSLHLNPWGKVVEKSPELAPEGFTDQKFRDLFLSMNPLHRVCTIYRKQVWQRYGGFQPQLTHTVDWELLRRLSQAPLNWYYIPRYLCGHRLDYAYPPTESLDWLATEDVWWMMELGFNYYSSQQLQQSKGYQYQRLFQWINGLFQAGKFAQGCAVLLDLVRYSGLGDRLWLVTLQQMSLEYKKTMMAMIQRLSQQLN